MIPSVWPEQREGWRCQRQTGRNAGEASLRAGPRRVRARGPDGREVICATNCRFNFRRGRKVSVVKITKGSMCYSNHRKRKQERISKGSEDLEVMDLF